MVFVPPPRPSPRAQELGRHLGEVVDQYRREHPDLSGMEIRQALRLAHRDSAARPAIIVLAVAAAVLGAALAAYSRKPGAEGSGFPVAIFAVILAILVLWVLFKRLR